jgi:hypothetical protein
MHEGKLENTLQGFQNGHLALCSGISRDFDFIGLSNFRGGRGGLFYIRLQFSSQLFAFRYRINSALRTELEAYDSQIFIVIFPTYHLESIMFRYQ